MELILHDRTSQEPRKLKEKRKRRILSTCMLSKRVKYKRNEKSACLYYPCFNKETRLR